MSRAILCVPPGIIYLVEHTGFIINESRSYIFNNLFLNVVRMIMMMRLNAKSTENVVKLEDYAKCYSVLTWITKNVEQYN